MAVTAKSGAPMRGRPRRSTCSSTRLANVTSGAPSMRVDVMGLGPHADALTAQTAPSVARRIRRWAARILHLLYVPSVHDAVGAREAYSGICHADDRCAD